MKLVRRFALFTGLAIFAALLLGSQPASANPVPARSLVIDVSQALPKRIDVVKGAKILFVRRALTADVEINATDGGGELSTRPFIGIIRHNGQRVEINTGLTIPPGTNPIHPTEIMRAGSGEIKVTLEAFGLHPVTHTITLIAH